MLPGRCTARCSAGYCANTRMCIYLSIYGSIHLSSTASPSCLGARGGLQPGQITSSLQGKRHKQPVTPKVNLESSIPLPSKFMSLDKYKAIVNHSSTKTPECVSIRKIFPLMLFIVPLHHVQAKVIQNLLTVVKLKTLSEFIDPGLKDHPFNANI